MEIAQANHVLDALDGGRVHGLDPSLRREPQLVPVIVDHLATSKLTVFFYSNLDPN